VLNDGPLEAQEQRVLQWETSLSLTVPPLGMLILRLEKPTD